MNPNHGIFVELLDQLSRALAPGMGVLRQEVLWLVGVLFFLEGVIGGIKILLGNASVRGIIIPLVVRTLVIVGCLSLYPTFVDMVYKGFIRAGLAAGGDAISIGKFMDPGAYLELGFRAGSVLYETHRKHLAWSWEFSPGMAIVYLLAFLAFIGAYAYMGLSVFIAQIEFTLATIGAVMLLPFAQWRGTSWIASGAISFPINLGFRFFFKALLASVVFPILSRNPWTQADIPSAAIMVLFAIVFGWLFKRAEHIAGGLLSGTPSLHAGHAIQTAVGTAVIAAAGVGLGKAALGAGTRTVLGSAQAIGRSVSAGRAGYQSGGVRGALHAGAATMTQPTVARLRQAMQTGRQGNWAPVGAAMQRTVTGMRSLPYDGHSGGAHYHG
jgi:type IV secretion system protein TrbL